MIVATSGHVVKLDEFSSFAYPQIVVLAPGLSRVPTHGNVLACHGGLAPRTNLTIDLFI